MDILDQIIELLKTHRANFFTTYVWFLAGDTAAWPSDMGYHLDTYIWSREEEVSSCFFTTLFQGYPFCFPLRTDWHGLCTCCSIAASICFWLLILRIEDVYPTLYETCGQYWLYIHSYIFFAPIFMQVTMIGLFGLKSNPGASIATITLLVLTILFNEYCKLRFLLLSNTFQSRIRRKLMRSTRKKIGWKSTQRMQLVHIAPSFLAPISFSDAGSSQQPSEL